MQISDLSFLPKAFMMTVLICACLLLPANSPAATVYPVHSLDISFDTASATMQGVSTVDFPANSGGSYHMQGLNILAISINDREIDLDDRSQDYFADPLHELVIQPSPQPTRVTVSYTLVTDAQANRLSDMITNDMVSLTGVWHPFLHQDVLFKLTATVPTGFEAVSEAEKITSTETDGGRKFSFFFPHPLTGISFIAAPFMVEKTPFGDNQELYTYFFPEDQDLVQGYRQKTLAYLERYEMLIGPFPYKRFSVVENRLPTGYAMPSFTVLGQAVARLPFITDTSLGHETLHQWFGNGIRSAPNSGNWAEGLTTILADYLYQADQGTDNEYRKNQLIRYQSYVHEDNELTLQDFKGAQSHLIGGQESMRAIGYTKAAMIFHMLRMQLGEEVFIKSLRNFYTRLAYSQASWADLRASFEEVSCEDLSIFFDQWLNRADTPIITINTLTVNEEDGRPVMRFTLRQANKEPYQLSLPVTIITDGGPIEQTIELEEKDTAIEIPLSAGPREMVIDGNYDLMRQLAPSELPPVWARFSGAVEKLAVLDPAQGTDVFQPLIDILTSMEIPIMNADEVTDQDIAAASTIFLGTSSATSRRLFALPDHPQTGLTVEVRANPLNDAETAVLVTAANQEEVARAAFKLKHYTKYSYLHFEQGRVLDKRIADSVAGQRFPIDNPPGGIEIRTNLSFDGIIDSLADKRVVYIGESHTRVEDHQLQLRVIRGMYRQNPNLAIGMEMFNRPVQKILDSYVLEQTIDEKEFLLQSHYFKKWGFDYRFYQQIINFARRNRIPVVALNLEKDIVSKVYREDGLQGLDEEQAAVLPENRDLSINGYRERISSVFRMHTPHQSREDQLNNFIQAQALWDETMAESAADFLKSNPDMRMAVIAGRGHVGKDNGIPPRVARRLEVDQAVVLNVEQREVDARIADFLVFSAPTSLPMPALMGVVLKEAEDRVLVDKLSPHGQAGKSGVKAGDIILALDDQPVASVEDIKIPMFYKKKGDKVKLKIKRIRRFLPDPKLEVEIPL